MAIELSDQASAAFDDIRNNPDTRYCPEVVSSLDNMTLGDKLNFRVESVEVTQPRRNFRGATLVALRPLDGEVSMTDLAAVFATNGAWEIISQSDDQMEVVYYCHPMFAEDAPPADDDGSSS